MSGALFTALWVQLCWGFVCTDLITSLEPTRSYVNLLTDCVFLILGIITIRSRRDIIVLVSFLTIAIVSAYINDQGIVMFANGFREFIGVIFTVPVIRYFLASKDAERFVRSFDKQLYIFLWLQVPCLVSQFIRFGASDYGGGSIGYGASGIISTFIYVISFYFMNKKWKADISYFQNIWSNRIYIFLLFPSFLNETKISFLFLIGYFVLLMTIDRNFSFRFILSIPLVAILCIIMANVYFMATGTDSSKFDSDYFQEYLVGHDIEDLMNLAILVQDGDIETDNIWVVDLPRYGRFALVPSALNDSNGGLLFGAGIGLFKGGNVLSSSPFATEYKWLIQGSLTMLFFILLQLGITGTLWLLYTVISTVFVKNTHPRNLNLLLYMLMVIALVFIYNDQYRYCYACMITFYICLQGLQPYISSESKRDSNHVQ